MGVLATMALAGCSLTGGGSKPPARSGTSSSTTTASPFDVTLPTAAAEPVSSTSGTDRSGTDRGGTATGAPTPTTPRTVGLATPQAASRNLWDGWRDDDRERALLYATPRAVTIVFARRWSSDVQLQACSIVGLGDPSVEGSKDEFDCIYRYGGSDDAVHVRVAGDPEAGYRVVGAERFGVIATTTEPLLDATTTTMVPTTRAGSKSKVKAKKTNTARR